ncbi:hypothetical protein ACT4ZN_11290 [Acinetobacter baumannii]
MALTPEIFRNLERDIDDVDKTLNTKGIITPRYGAPFKSLPLALEKVENNGGYISAPTLAALQAITPTYNHQVARVDATGDEYRWNPNASPAPKWEPTGRNYLNESKTYTDQKVLDLNTNIEGVLTGEVLPYIDNGDDLVQAAAAMDATTKANTAKSEAIAAAAMDATTKANTAKSEAIAAAAMDATTKANTAKSEAIAAAAMDATTKANTAKSEAIDAAAIDATNKANTAKSEAIDAAAMDATTKANTAKSEAIAAAAMDATTKANTAKSEAIAAAAMDATTKANTAEENAKNYADSNANFTFKVLTETDHLDDLKVSGTYTALNKIVASTSRGYPVNEAGALRVVKHSNSNSTQHEYLTFSGKLYIRRFIASWSAWVAQATSAETDAAKAEIMGVALVNRGVVTGSAITNLTDVGLYSVSNMTDFPSDFPATFGILKRYKFGSYAYWELSSTSRPDVTWQKVGVSAWRKISLEESVSAATSAAVSQSLAVSLADKGLISGGNISDLLAVGLYAVSDMLDFPSDFPATYGILKRFKFSGYAYWELSTTSRPDIVWQKVGVAAWRKISVEDALAPFASKDSLTLNRDKLYPMLALTRAVAANTTVQALEKHILDIKVNGANPDCYYRISYYGNNSTLASEANKFGWILQEISKAGFAETGGTVKALTASATTKYEIVPNSGIVQFTLQSTVDTSISFDFTVDTTGFDTTVLFSHAVFTSQAWGHIIDPIKYVLKQGVDVAVIDEKIATNNKQIEALPALPVITATSAGLVPIDLSGNANYSGLLFSKSISTSIAPASVTKVMSVIVALESGMTLNTLLTVAAGDIATGSGNNLLEGDQITLLDALFNMMLPSSNTSANLVARSVGEFLGGDTATFISRMNSKAVDLGMTGTTFKNPSGLAASGHASTVSDLLKLGVYASKNATMLSIWGQLNHTISIQGSNPRSIIIDSSVDPIVNGEPWAIGGKTGTLAPSIYNMLLFVRLRNGFTGVAVTVGSSSNTNRYSDVKSMVEYVRNAYAYPAPPQIVLKN